MSERCENIIYSPLNLVLHLVALLPFGALYKISDVLCFIVYRVIGYRRRVVRKNLTECFPDKTAEDILALEREFYQHFTDYFFETVKLLHVSDAEMRRRCVFEGADLIDEAFDEGRSIIMYASHYGNWEWLTSVTLWTRHRAFADAVYAQVYRPLNNRWFDRFFLNLRGRFHSVCLSKKTVFRDLLRYRRDGKLVVTGFISDQHPNVNDQGHVIRFLNHDTAMITGAEVIIRKLDYVALHFDMEKVSRGHYKVTIAPICHDPKLMPVGEITDRYAQRLERRIMGAPQYWLWTHNRWKHKVNIQHDDNN